MKIYGSGRRIYGGAGRNNLSLNVGEKFGISMCGAHRFSL